MTIRLVDAMLWCLGVIPESVSRLLGAFLGFMSYRILRFRVQVVREQLAASFPDLPETRRRIIERDFYRHLGLTIIETLRLTHATAESIIRRTVIHGREHADAAFADGKGMFILAGHNGNWELAMAAVSVRDYPLSVVVKEIKSGPGQHLVDKIRGTHGTKTIPRRNSIREIFKVLKANELVGFVLDQNMTREEGVFVNFFGRPACTMPGLAVMVRRLQIPVIPMSCYRDEHHVHHIELFPPVPWEEPDGATKDEVIRHNTQRYVAVTEKIIRQRPDQWLWVHKRWKTKPPPA